MSLRPKLRSVLKDLAPPLLLRFVRGRVRTASFSGSYRWEEARRLSGAGYADTSIVQSTLERTRRLAQGPATSMLGSRDLRLLAALEWALLRASAEEVTVIDFGGAMGSHYFALRRFLPRSVVRWKVVDVEPTVREAQRHFTSEELSFHAELPRDVSANTIGLASGALQYCEHPREAFRDLAQQAHTLIVDRLPLTRLRQDRLTVQTLPQGTPGGIYPAWFFARDSWATTLAELGLTRVLEWSVPEDGAILDGEAVSFCGMLLQRSNA